MNDLLAASDATKPVGHSDAPLTRPEGDLLGRAKFAQELAKVLHRAPADYGFVIALYGPWGSGKTTVVNFAEHYLQEGEAEARPILVRFNPWWFSGTEQILTAFMAELREAVAPTGGRDKKLRALGSKFDAYTEVLCPALSVFGLDSVAKVLGGLRGLRKEVARRNTDVTAVRGKLDEALKENGRRIVVVMDDIDRLAATEIRQVFQLVKAVADFPNTLYVLAFDHDVVARALEEVQGGTGQDYLEKIVQLPLDLPPPSPELMLRWLTNQLDAVAPSLGLHGWDQVRWGNVFHDGIKRFIQTPRDAKRFANRVQSTWPIVCGEVDAVDFLGIECLATFAPALYRTIQASKDYFAGAERDFPHRSNPAAREPFYTECLGLVGTELREPARGLMKRLFPKVNAAYGGSSHGPQWETTWRRALRVCASDCFGTFFCLSVPEGSLTAAEIRDGLSLTADSDAFAGWLERLMREEGVDGHSSRAREFLDRIQDFTEHTDRIPDQNIQPLLAGLYRVADRLVERDPRRGMFDSGREMDIARITHQLLRRVAEQDDRFAILEDLLEDCSSLFVGTYQVSLLEQELEETTQTDPNSGGPTIGGEHLDALRLVALAKIVQATENGYLRTAPGLVGILWRWAKWASPEEPRAYVEGWIASDEGLAEFVGRLLQPSFSATMGDSVGRRLDQMPIEDIEKLAGGINTLLDRAETVLTEAPAWLTANGTYALQCFVRDGRLHQKADKD